MDRRKLQTYLSQKSWLWQKIFAHFYLTPLGFSPTDCKTDFEAQTAVKFCRNEDDLLAVWDLADYIDSHEKELIGTIEDIHYCRPLPWQYDFVQNIFKQTQHPLLKQFNLDSVADAFCLAVLTPQIDVSSVMQELDATYATLYASAAHKQNILRRNLSLTLEMMFPLHRSEYTTDLNCRELVDSFVPRGGVEGIAKALKHARTAETKLSPEERACLAFAYYSPYFCVETDISQQFIPGNSIFECAEDRLHEEQMQREQMEAFVRENSTDDEDDDDIDEVSAFLQQKHNAVYIDPQERCIIDVVRNSPLYAHVYIEKFPQDDLNNSLPDFICYHKGWLYTVEFVDDLKELKVAQGLNKRLNSIKREALRMEKAWLEEPSLALNGLFQRKAEKLQQNLRTCFYISD